MDAFTSPETQNRRDAIQQGVASPFNIALAPYADTLPPALYEQYFVSPLTPYRIILEGQMEKVWHRPRWLKPFFYPLAWAKILFPETGEQVPAQMIVTGVRDKMGAAAQTWHRTFIFPPIRRFNALMAYDPIRDCVVEWLGPFQMLCMAWEITFHPPNTIEIKTTGCSLHIGRVRVQLPHLFYPFVRAVEQAVSGQDEQIDVALTVSHPLLGNIFGYNGIFTLRREPVPPA